MDNPTIPIRYHCRNARLCLQKASFSRKAELVTDELQHLRNFETIVSVTLPAHPFYKRTDKEVLDLEKELSIAKRRINELGGFSYNKLPQRHAHNFTPFKSPFVPSSNKVMARSENKLFFSASLSDVSIYQEDRASVTTLLNSEDVASLRHKYLGHLEGGQGKSCRANHMIADKDPSAVVQAMSLSSAPVQPNTAVTNCPAVSVPVCRGLTEIHNGDCLNHSSKTVHKHFDKALGGREGEEVHSKTLRNTERMAFQMEEKVSSRAKANNGNSSLVGGTNDKTKQLSNDAYDIKLEKGQGMKHRKHSTGICGMKRLGLDCSEDDDDADLVSSSSTSPSVRQGDDSPCDETSSQDSQSGADILSLDSMLCNSYDEWNWVKSASFEADKTAGLVEDTKRLGGTEAGKDLPKEVFCCNDELGCAEVSSMSTKDVKTTTLTVDDAAKNPDRPLLNQETDRCPIKWPTLFPCDTVEDKDKSDYSVSTFEQQKFPATPGQTTFSNPVFDFNPPMRSNGGPPDVQALQLNAHDDDGTYACLYKMVHGVLGDFVKADRPVPTLIEEQHSDTGKQKEFKDSMVLFQGNGNSKDGPLQSFTDVSKNTKSGDVLNISRDNGIQVISFNCLKDHAGLIRERTSSRTQRLQPESCMAGENQAPQIEAISIVHCAGNEQKSLQALLDRNKTRFMLDRDDAKHDLHSGIAELSIAIKNLRNDFLLLESKVTVNMEGKLKGMIDDLEIKCVGANQKLEEHNFQVSSLKECTNALMLNQDQRCNRKEDYATAEQLDDICKKLEADIDRLKQSNGKDLSSFKEEVIGMFKASEASNKHWGDSDLEEKVDKEILQIAEVFSDRQEKMTGKLRQEVSCLKAECDIMLNWKVEVQAMVELLRQHMEEVKKKSMLQGKEWERFCTILPELEEFREETSYELLSIRQVIVKLMRENACCWQATVKLETTLHSELNKLQKIVEQNVKDVAAKLAMLEDFAQSKEELESKWKHERESERALMMDKLETLSSLYLGGLDELRVALLNLKLGFGNKIEELAKCLESPCDTAQEQREGEPDSRNSSTTSATSTMGGAKGQSLCNSFHITGGKVYEACTGLSCSLSELTLQGNKTFGMKMGGSAFISKRTKELLLQEDGDNGKIPRAENRLQVHEEEEYSDPMTLMLVDRKEIVEGIIAEMIGLVKKAREMLDQIETTKQWSAEIVKEMAQEKYSLKERDSGFNNSMGEEALEECSKQEQSSPWKPAASNHPASSCTKLMPELACLTSHFIRKATTDMVALENSEHILLQMIKASNLHGHEKLQKAVREIANRVQDKDGSEGIIQVLESWDRAIDDGTARMACLGHELTKVKERISSIIASGANLTRGLDQHLRSTEIVVTGKEPVVVKVEALTRNDCVCLKADAMEKQQQMIKWDVERIDEDVKSLTFLVEELKGGRKVPPAESIEAPMKQVRDIMQKMHEIGSKVIKLESFQLDMSHKFEDYQLKVREVDASAAAWGPKYETAARILNEVEMRLRMVEGLLWNRTEKGRQQSTDKKQFLCLYVDEPSMHLDATNAALEDMATCSPPSEYTNNKKPENRVVTLESRIEHVASAAYANLRYESKCKICPLENFKMRQVCVPSPFYPLTSCKEPSFLSACLHCYGPSNPYTPRFQLQVVQLF